MITIILIINLYNKSPCLTKNEPPPQQQEISYQQIPKQIERERDKEQIDIKREEERKRER